MVSRSSASVMVLVLMLGCNNNWVNFASTRHAPLRLGKTLQASTCNIVALKPRYQRQSLAECSGIIRRASGTDLKELAMVSAYISADVGILIMSDVAGNSYIRPALMLLSALTSFGIGSLASWLRDGHAGLRKATFPGRWVRLLPVSGLFAMSTWCTLHAVTYLSPVLVKVLFQLKLPFTVILSTVLLKRRYTFLQVHALTIVSLAVTAFTCLRVGDTSNLSAIGASGAWSAAAVGCFYACAAVVCSVLASLVAERALKENTDTPLYTLVANLKLGEALVTFTALCLLPGAPLHIRNLLASPACLIEGFNFKVWMLMAVMVTDAWMSAILVKQLSSLAKALSKCLSMLVLYVLSLAVFKTEELALPQFILGIIVGMGIQLFTYATMLSKRSEIKGGAPK